MRADQAWRLEAVLEEGALDEVVAHLRGRDVDAADWPLPEDVVVTHDGNRLVAYAPSEASIALARNEVEALPHQAAIVVSHWDGQAGEWVPLVPPLAAGTGRHKRADTQAGESVETRTMVATAGRLVRGEIEEVMREVAANLHLRLSVTEHRHLLTCQVLFEVTGPRRKIDEFAEGLNAYELATIRTERAVMMSPL